MTLPRHRERLFDAVNMAILAFCALLTLYPLYFVVIASFSAPADVSLGRVVLWPRGVTGEGYREVLRYAPLWRGYLNTILYTTIGTLINVSLSLSAGYALSRDDLPAKRAIAVVFSAALFFQGGLIPRYLLVRNLGLMDSVGAMVLPNAVNVVYLLMCRTFFRATIPAELLDAARMDGSSTFRFFFRIVLPLCPALVSIMFLYYGIFHWNAFFDAFLFLSDRNRQPIQVVLRDLIIQNQSASIDMDPMAADSRQKLADLIKYGAIIFSSAPVLVVYPFLQRFFVKGVMIGAVKG